jgi:hypothetical protein
MSASRYRGGDGWIGTCGGSMRPDAVEVYQDKAGDWRWRIVAPNGEVIGDSAEGYANHGHAMTMAVRIGAGGMEVRTAAEHLAEG